MPRFYPSAGITLSRYIAVLFCMLALSACKMAPAAWFGAQQADHANNGIIGALDYPELIDPGTGTRAAAVMRVVEINGKSVGEHDSYIVVPPGKYKISIFMLMSASDVGWQGGTRRWDDDVEIDVAAGHVYVPGHIKRENMAKLFMIDKGASYPVHCLPFATDPRATGVPGPECATP